MEASSSPSTLTVIRAASFEKGDGPDPRICTGTMTLYHGDTAVGSIPLTTQAGKFSIAGEGLTVGRDAGAPVTDDYPGTEPWAFTGGTVHRVRVEVSGTPYIDLEREAQAMLMRE